MEVWWDYSSDGSQSRLFFCYFIDYIIKGYSGQDHIQVGDIFQKMKQVLKETNPSLKEVFIQSYNATFFASQELDTFFSQLNALSDGTTIKRWDFTKE